VQRFHRLLTWKRARHYSVGIGFIYIFAWCLVLVTGSPPLNSGGEPLGGDYIAFYSAGKVLLAGDGAHLYDHATIVRIQDEALGGLIPRFYDAFRNPPFFALPFAPLALLPLLPSFAVWAVLSFVFLAIALWLLVDLVPSLRRRWRGLVVIVFAFGPVYFGIINGQNSTLALLVYVLIYRSLVRGEDRAAGVWAALGLFKPQLFFLFPLIFLVTRRWRALAAYSLTAAGLALLSFAVVGPDGALGWLRILIDMEQGNALRNAWRMHSLKAFFDQLLPGQSLLSLALYGVVSIALVLVLLRAWSRRPHAAPDLWAFTLLVAVLVDPHLVDYDLTVLVAAGVFAAALPRSVLWLMVLLYPMLVFRAQLPLGDAAVQLSTLVLLSCLYVLRAAAFHSRGWQRHEQDQVSDRDLATTTRLSSASRTSA
jgi:alpha-1,2-mannosyltransferase